MTSDHTPMQSPTQLLTAMYNALKQCAYQPYTPTSARSAPSSGPCLAGGPNAHAGIHCGAALTAVALQGPLATPTKTQHHSWECIPRLPAPARIPATRSLLAEPGEQRPAICLQPGLGIKGCPRRQMHVAEGNAYPETHVHARDTCRGGCSSSSSRATAPQPQHALLTQPTDCHTQLSSATHSGVL
jgi:hypothetical protein